MSYTPPSGTLDPTWVGASSYVPAYSVRSGNWDPTHFGFDTVGFTETAYGTPFITKQQFISTTGISSGTVQGLLITHEGEYIPPYATLNANWVGAPSYTPHDDTLNVQWVITLPVDAYIYPSGIAAGDFGTHLIWVYQYVDPIGIPSAAYGRTRIYRDGEYLPYDGYLNASWDSSGDFFYAPRSGVLLVGWPNPTGIRTLFPFGISDEEVGSCEIGYFIRYIEPPGFVFSVVEAPAIRLTVEFITPNGILAFASGTPNIYNFFQEILVGGIAHPVPQVSSVDVSFRNRTIVTEGIPLPPDQIPTHSVTHFTQYVDLAGRSIVSNVYGTASFTFFNREIQPPFIIGTSYGIPTVWRIQTVQPTGWEDSTVSSGARIDINLQRLFPDSGSVDPAEYGNTQVRNQHEVLRPSGFLSQDINFPIVFNQDRYIFVAPYMDTNSDPTEWPHYYPFVENKNRVLGPSGFISSKFSVIGNVIYNKAVPIYPTGSDLTEFGADTFISHYTRYIAPEGWDSFYNSQYTVVYNAAVVIAPNSWVSSHIATPTEVSNLNRDIKQFFPYDGLVFGTAFIAPRVRTIASGLFYDIPASFPEIRLDPFPIAPTSINPPQLGAPDVFERFTIIYPRSTNVHPIEWVGEPIIENRNKTLRVFPSDQSLYGIPRIYNYVQTVEIGGGDLLLVGSHLVAYRTKRIYPAPTSIPVFTVTHRIRNLIPDPPATQGIYPFGYFIGNTQVPAPSFGRNTIYVPSIEDAEVAFGPVKVTTNNIRPTSIYDDTTIGVPSFPFVRTIEVESFPPSTYFFAQVSPALRFDPFHIYAPAGDQTPPNYTPGTGGEPIDSVAVFGSANVSLKNRTIGPVPNHAVSTVNRPTVFGDAEFILKLRYIHPRGFIATRIPNPIFFGVPQYIYFGGEWDPPGIDASAIFGTTSIAHYVTPTLEQYVTPNGLNSFSMATHKIELFNRSIAVPGIPHRGNPQQFLTNPWGDALVGYPRKIQISAGVQTLWGSHVLEYKNRTYYVTGWNSCSLDFFDIDDLIEPMRVTYRLAAGSISGIPPGPFGLPHIGPKNRSIYARGFNAYKSGNNVVNSVSYIDPVGWNSEVFGNIDEWEAGKIKPYGDDLSTVGIPHMYFIVNPPSLSDFEMGDPSFGRAIYPLGLPPIGFAGPSVTDIDGCNTRVVVPLPTLPETIPSPVVSNV